MRNHIPDVLKNTGGLLIFLACEKTRVGDVIMIKTNNVYHIIALIVSAKFRYRFG